jgi:hypothetical protein
MMASRGGRRTVLDCGAPRRFGCSSDGLELRHCETSFRGPEMHMALNLRHCEGAQRLRQSRLLLGPRSTGLPRPTPKACTSSTRHARMLLSGIQAFRRRIVTC